MPEHLQNNLDTALTALEQQLCKQIDEHELRTYLESALPEFECLYKADPCIFSDEIVDRLMAARLCHRALRNFIEICEDIEDVPTKEEAEHLMHRLHEIAEPLSEFAVRARIEKEYRGLKEKLVHLPSTGSDPYDMERNRRINILNRDAPNCKKPNCGAPMVISASKANAWWRCSTFPKCYGYKRLTKKQRAYLEKD